MRNFVQSTRGRLLSAMAFSAALMLAGIYFEAYSLYALGMFFSLGALLDGRRS